MGIYTRAKWMRTTSCSRHWNYVTMRVVVLLSQTKTHSTDSGRMNMENMICVVKLSAVLELDEKVFTSCFFSLSRVCCAMIKWSCDGPFTRQQQHHKFYRVRVWFQLRRHKSFKSRMEWRLGGGRKFEVGSELTSSSLTILSFFISFPLFSRCFFTNFTSFAKRVGADCRRCGRIEASEITATVESSLVSSSSPLFPSLLLYYIYWLQRSWRAHEEEVVEFANIISRLFLWLFFRCVFFLPPSCLHGTSTFLLISLFFMLKIQLEIRKFTVCKRDEWVSELLHTK